MLHHGNLTGSVTVWHDITRLLEVEQAFGESEERYRLLARNMSDVISRHGRNGAVQFVSPAAEADTVSR